jgi:hypothetical protein
MLQNTNLNLKVFISYSRHDLEIADSLVEALEQYEFQVLIDRRDLPYGEEWQHELDGFIRSSDTIIWLVSNNSVKSDWCNWELGLATSLNKRLIPIKVRDLDLADLPKAIGKIHLLPAEGIFSLNQHLQLLINVLNTDHIWLKEATRLADRARQWLNKSRDGGLLLRGANLHDAEQWEKSRPRLAPAPSREVLELILTSRQVATRRYKYLIVGSLSVAVLTVALASYALLKSHESEVRAVEAQVELSKVFVATGEPFRALRLAVDSASAQIGLGVDATAAEQVIYDLLWNAKFPVSSLNLNEIAHRKVNPNYLSLAYNEVAQKYALCGEEELNCFPIDRDGLSAIAPAEYSILEEFTGGESLKVDVTSKEVVVTFGRKKFRELLKDGAEPNYVEAYQCFGEFIILYLQRSYTLINVRSGQSIPLDYDEPSYQTQYQPQCHQSGKYFALTSDFESIWLYEVETGRLIAPQLTDLVTMRHGFSDLNGIVSISVPHGLFMVSGANVTTKAGAAGHDGKIQPKIYSLDSGQVLASLEGHDASLVWGYFVDDGSRIVTLTEAGTVLSWENVFSETKTEEALSGCDGDIWREYYRYDWFNFNENRGYFRCYEGDLEIPVVGYDKLNMRTFGSARFKDRVHVYTGTRDGTAIFGRFSDNADHKIANIWPISKEAVFVVDSYKRLFVLTRGKQAEEFLLPHGPIQSISMLDNQNGEYLIVANGKVYALRFEVDESITPVLEAFSGFGTDSMEQLRKTWGFFLKTAEETHPNAVEAVGDSTPEKSNPEYVGGFHRRGDVLMYCENAHKGWGEFGENCVFLNATTGEMLSNEHCVNAELSERAAICLVHNKSEIAVFDFTDRKMIPVNWPGFIDPDFTEVEGNLNLSLIEFESCSSRIGLAYEEFISGGGGISSPGVLIFDLDRDVPLLLDQVNSKSKMQDVYCSTDELLKRARSMLSRFEIRK